MSGGNRPTIPASSAESRDDEPRCERCGHTAACHTDTAGTPGACCADWVDERGGCECPAFLHAVSGAWPLAFVRRTVHNAPPSLPHFARAPTHEVATHETVDADCRRIRFNAGELARLRATDTDPEAPAWIRVDPWTLPERFIVGCAWRVSRVVEACERGPCGVRRIGRPF